MPVRYGLSVYLFFSLKISTNLTIGDISDVFRLPGLWATGSKKHQHHNWNDSLLTVLSTRESVASCSTLIQETGFVKHVISHSTRCAHHSIKVGLFCCINTVSISVSDRHQCELHPIHHIGHLHPLHYVHSVSLLIAAQIFSFCF